MLQYTRFKSMIPFYLMASLAFYFPSPTTSFSTPTWGTLTFSERSIKSSPLLTQLNVKASSLTSELPPEEQKIVDLVRTYGPSVALITSTLTRPTPPNNRRQRPRTSQNPNTGSSEGRSLGSGSGFLITEDGYLLTNYHVIQRAYEINATVQDTSQRLPLLSSFINATVSIPAVLVRINSSTKYRPARVVGVRPEYDVAVLKIDIDNGERLIPIPAGSSSKLLVGQRLVAIGNPFGLDQSVSSGVVSALNREITTYGNQKIRGCIQTDAAINPGNSGGPLLDSRGKWMGVNTAIITTSGSSAGIGFAVPVDTVKDTIDEIVENDRLQRIEGRRGRGSLGVKLLDDELSHKLGGEGEGVVIASVEEGSAGQDAGLRSLKVESSGSIMGDKIVAVNAKPVANSEELKREFKGMKEGEKVTLTVQALDGMKDKRVVYVTLNKKKVVV